MTSSSEGRSATVVLIMPEEELDLERALSRGLREGGCDVFVAHRGREGLRLLEAMAPWLVIVVQDLDDMAGVEVCRAMRARASVASMRVILVTAPSRREDCVAAFEAGVDDCVSRPVAPDELLLRAHALLAPQALSARGRVRGPLVVGEVAIDQQGHRVRIAGDEVALTALEFRLLWVLASRAQRVLSREKLLREVWGGDVRVTRRSVDQLVKRLRDKLGTAGSSIQAVRASGYQLVPVPSAKR